MNDIDEEAEKEIANSSIKLYRSISILTDGDTLSDETKAEILEKRAEELRGNK